MNVGLSRLILCGALLTAGVGLLGGCGKEPTVGEHIAQAQALMDKGDVRQASIELSNALQKAPNDGNARWLMARVALQMGDGARAEKEAKRALELGLGYSTLQPLIAQALLYQGKAEEVLRETERIDAGLVGAQKATLLGLRAQALLLMGRKDEAHEALQEAFGHDPNALSALIGMTAYHGLRQEQAQARRWAERLLQVHPNSPEGWSALGDLEIGAGHYPQAEMAYGKAIELRPFTNLDQAKRALARLHQGKYKEAEADIAALRQSPYQKHPYVDYVDGLSHWLQKRYKEAAGALAAAHANAPDFPPVRYHLALAYLQLGQHEKALKLAQQLDAQLPRLGEVKRLLGAIHIERGEFDLAKSSLEQALARNPEDPALLELLARLHLQTGEAQKGLEYAERLAHLAPGSQEVQAMLVMARFLAGRPFSELPADPYTQALLNALQTFRSQPAQALAQARALAQKYPDKVAPLNLAAASLMAMGREAEAKAELEKVLRLKPDDPSANHNLALIEVRRGNVIRARDLLRTVVRQQPDNESAVLLLADLERRTGEARRARPLLEAAYGQNPRALGVRVSLAREYLQSGEVSKVLELTRELDDGAVRAQPALLEVRGRALLANGDVPAARREFERWVRLAPNSAPAHFHLALAHNAAGARKEGRAALERAVKLDPRLLPARVAEVRMLVDFKELARARQALARLKQEFGEHPEVLGLEGWFALGTGDYVRAERQLAAALKVRPDPELAILQVRALWVQNKREAALRFMQDWLKARPRDLAVLMHLAGAYLEMGRAEEARAVYARVVQHYPNHIVALNNLAWLGRHANLDEAIKHARRAQELAPQDPYVLDTLGMLLIQRGETEQGQRLITQAAERAPKDLDIQTHYAQVLIQQGRGSEARKTLERLIREAPAGSDLSEARRLLQGLTQSGG